jgi:16S rRNA C967 or C1407 C5-methylase (RsmB/RsmF family)
MGTGEREGDITGTQRDLLLRGFDVLAPDGVLVYSTCSYNPRENESVVDHLLRSRPARVLPVHLDVPHDPGITAWQGEVFHEDLLNTWRIYPNRLNTVGFFLAKIAPR